MSVSEEDKKSVRVKKCDDKMILMKSTIEQRIAYILYTDNLRARDEIRLKNLLTAVSSEHGLDFIKAMIVVYLHKNNSLIALLHEEFGDNNAILNPRLLTIELRFMLLRYFLRYPTPPSDGPKHRRAKTK